MKFFPVVILIVLLSLFIVNCDEDNVTGDCTDQVQVKVDLIVGFQGHNVRVKFNGDVYFKADLTESVPFSGPVAAFTTTLPRGTNQCEVNWRDGGLPYNTHTQEISFGDADMYYVGIMASDDSTLVIGVRDYPYGYL